MAARKKCADGSDAPSAKGKRGPPKRGAPSPTDEPPNHVLDTEDRGDETQRNFRYQHAYGVILLIGAALKKQPYVALWCEHHEDLLAERTDGQWEGYQVKTRQREQGEWTLGDTEMCGAIKHLVHLNVRFPKRIANLHVVSNARFLDTDGEQNAHRSLPRLLDAVRKASAPNALAPPFDKAFKKLAAEISYTHEPLFVALRKMSLKIGPERESFDAEIAHNHVPHLAGCAGLTRAQLNALRDELVARVYRASSLGSDDPARHWCCVSGEDRNHPEIAAKRITIQDLFDVVADRQSAPFRYLPGTASLKPGTVERKLPVLEAKLLAAGLQSQVETFRDRMLATERRLLEVTEAAPESTTPLLDQIEGVVKGEYAEALLAAEQQSRPYGRRLLQDFYGRLRVAATDRPEIVERQPYELLVGVAAMLTAECHLWWGPKFDLGGAK